MKKTTYLLLLLASAFGFSQNCNVGLPIPYSENFQAQTTFPACWATENSDNINPVWALNSVIDTNQDGAYDHVALISPNSSAQKTKNDWLFTPLLSFTAGTAYNIDIVYNTFAFGGVTSNQKFDLYLIDSQNSTANKTLLSSYTNITASGTLYSNTGDDLLTQAYHTNHIFTPTVSGNYHLAIHANETNNSGFLMIFSLDVTSSTLSNDHFLEESLLIHYNVLDENLAVTNNNDNITKIEVYNVIGQSVKNQNFNDKNVTMSLSALPNGVYIAHITAGNRILTRKFIKQ